MTEKELLEKINEGNIKAFEELFRLYYDRLLKFIWGYVNSEAIAEELVQELFTRIWEKKEGLHIEVSLRTYLFQSARNISIDYLRHQKVERSWEDEKKALHMNKSFSNGVDKKLHNKMLLDEIEKAIKSLPERRRLVFILSRFNDMSHKEIAEFMDISVYTVETQIGRALHTLRKRFSHLLAHVIIFSGFFTG